MEIKQITPIENTADNTEQNELYDIAVMTKQSLASHMSDEEIGMPDIDEEWNKIQARVQSVSEEKEQVAKIVPINRWKNIAAIFAGLVIISGIAFATIRVILPKQDNPVPVPIVANDSVAQKPAPVPELQLPEEIVFDDTKLENMLDTISRHYKMKVQFANDNLKGIRLYYTFITSRTIDKVIRDLNHFNKMTITRDDETIYVNPKSK